MVTKELAEENPRGKDEQAIQDAGSGIRTQSTVAGGERRIHCIIPALHNLL